VAGSKAITSEAKLVRELKRGNTDAVAQVYNTYIDRVYSLIFNQVDRDHEVAQEIVQETFSSAIRSAEGFHGRSSIFTWLCSIANNKVADYYRRKKRETKKRVDYAPELTQPSDRDQDVSSLAESAETGEFVRQALSALPLHYKQVLILKYVEEFTVSDISQMMGRSQKSIEGLITRARKELHIRLDKKNEG